MTPTLSLTRQGRRPRPCRSAWREPTGGGPAPCPQQAVGGQLAGRVGASVWHAGPKACRGFRSRRRACPSRGPRAWTRDRCTEAPAEVGAGGHVSPGRTGSGPAQQASRLWGFGGLLVPKEVQEQRAVGRWPGEPSAGGDVGAVHGVWSCWALSEPRGQGRGSEGAGGRAAPVCILVGRPWRRKSGEPCPSQPLPPATPVVPVWLTARLPRFLMAIKGMAPWGSPRPPHHPECQPV